MFKKEEEEKKGLGNNSNFDNKQKENNNNIFNNDRNKNKNKNEDNKLNIHLDNNNKKNYNNVYEQLDKNDWKGIEPYKKDNNYLTSNYNTIANRDMGFKKDYNYLTSNYNTIANRDMGCKKDNKKFEELIKYKERQYNHLNPSKDRTNVLNNLKTIVQMGVVGGINVVNNQISNIKNISKGVLEGIKDLNNQISNIKNNGLMEILKNGLSNIDKKVLKDAAGKFIKHKLTNGNFIDNCVDKVGNIFKSPSKKKKSNMNLDLKENINITKIMQKKELYKNEKNNEKLNLQLAKKENMENGIMEWNNRKNKIMENRLNEINYLYIIEEFINEIDKNFKKEIEKKIEEIYKKNFEEISFLTIHKRKVSYLKTMKDNIPEIQTLNILMAGFTGSGKTCLTNVLLKKNLSKEGDTIKPETNEFTQFSNPEIPGLTIIDTIGVEETNEKQNIENIKKMIKEKFDSNIKNPQNSLHGILYCIKNGSGETRILKEEINYIKELNHLYDDNDILTIVFTQSINNKTEIRKKELIQELNNNNIEIIELMAKDYICKRNNKILFEVKAYGLNNLMQCLKKKCQKNLVLCNLKQIAKEKIKEKYFDDINIQYKDLIKKIRCQEFKENLNEEFKFILENLICDLKINFKDLENIINSYIDNLIPKIIENIININIESIIEKINEEFIILNARYNNDLQVNMRLVEILKIKFEKFFKPKIQEELNKIFLEKACLMFIKITKIFIGEKISEKIEDKEINELADSNINNLLQKINIEYESDS